MENIKYTVCQEKAIASAIEAYKNDGRLFGLYGGGGTGKTFTASKIIESLQNLTPGESVEVLLVTPTNSALKSLKKSFLKSKAANLTFKTIHSALGILPDFDDKGRIIFQKKKETGEDIGWEYKIIFIDEASMVSKDLSAKILDKARECGAFGIASGDKAQLFPINEKSSHLIDVIGITTTLNEIVRQHADNPISLVIKNARDAVEEKFERYDPRRYYGDSMTNEKKEGYYVFYDNESGLKQITRAYVKAYERQDYQFVKLVAYTNRQCKTHNNYIRGKLWGEFAATKEYIPGDLVVCKAPVMERHIDPNSGREVTVTVLTTGTECMVISALPIEKEFNEMVLSDPDENGNFPDPKYKTIKYSGWLLKLKDLECDQEKIITVEVINALDASRFKGNKERLRSECVRFKTQFNRNVWFRFFGHESIFHDFSHSYCVTIHFTQGKTYNVVGVDAADINNYAPDDDTRNRLYYVATSRAKKFLLMI